MSHLLQVIRLEPSFDVDYLAFTARRSAEADAAGAGNASTGMARVAFEKHLNDARLCTLQAAQAQVRTRLRRNDCIVLRRVALCVSGCFRV